MFEKICVIILFVCLAVLLAGTFMSKYGVI
jgi:hypothetical protein